MTLLCAKQGGEENISCRIGAKTELIEGEIGAQRGHRFCQLNGRCRRERQG